ncbi:MAG TPA: tetratricopeptide repeat protein, partial [Terriglobales bacterium]
IKMNQQDAALPLLRKAIQIKPNLAMAHLDLGIIYSNKGRQSEALAELKLAAKINPEDVAVHWRLAQLYRAMGRKADAEAEFEKTKTLTKAADESVSSKLHGDNSRAKESPATAEPAKN